MVAPDANPVIDDPDGHPLITVTFDPDGGTFPLRTVIDGIRQQVHQEHLEERTVDGEMKGGSLRPVHANPAVPEDVAVPVAELLDELYEVA